MRQPCTIKDCPALRAPDSFYCAVHTAMTDDERKHEQDNAACSGPPLLRPVTARIDYEKP
jgi:hypothetical protein